MKAYVFHNGEVELHHEQLPTASRYPVGTWACAMNGHGPPEAWIRTIHGGMLFGEDHYEWIIDYPPPEYRVQLLLIKD